MINEFDANLAIKIMLLGLSFSSKKWPVLAFKCQISCDTVIFDFNAIVWYCRKSLYKQHIRTNMRKLSHFLALVAVSFACASATAAAEKTGSRSLVVTATAYNSLSSQTDSSPQLTAWGFRLTPGVKAIAVSRDLLHQYGLTHRAKVRISGLNGEFVVLDKMHARWKKKIDIFMGDDRQKAQRFGRRNVTIKW